MTDTILQDYLDIRQDYDIAEHRWGELSGDGPLLDSEADKLWAIRYGLYKVARYNAVRAGLIPETPQFDVEDARARRREALRELTRLTEEYGGYEELKGDNEETAR